MTGIISDFFDQINAKSAHILTSTSETLSAMVEGSSYTGNFTVVPILDSRKEYIASYESTGITFTGDVFVTAVDNPAKVNTNGDYYINYLTGYYKVLAATGATPTASYYTFMPAISSVVDVELGAVEIKDSVSDDRANILTDNGAYPTGTTKGLNVFVGRYQSSPSTFDDGDAAPVLLDENGRIVLSSDIEIGAVELKDGSSENRAVITSASTSRSTSTNVLSVQELDSTGKVSPAGDTVDNAPFVKLGDGTDTLDVLKDNVAFPTGTTTGLAVFGRYEATPSTFDDGDAAPILLDENGRIVLSSDIEIGAVELEDGESGNRAVITSADTARSTATNVLAVQNIDSNGEIITLNLIETIESEIEILTGNTVTLIELSGILTGDTSTLIVLSGIVTGDTSTLISLSETLTGDTSTLIGLDGVLTGDTSTIISLLGTTTGDTSSLISLVEILTGDTTTLLDLTESLTGDTRTLISLSQTLTGDTASLVTISTSMSGDTASIRDSVEATNPQAYGIDAVGADAYTTVVTATAQRTHISISLQGSYDAIVSVDGGTTDSFYVIAGSVQTYDSVLLANGAMVQGKNANAGQNYTKLAITIW